MKIQTFSLLFCAIICALFFPSPLMADDPGGMPNMLLPPEDIEVEDGGTEKWFVYRPAVDGVLLVIAHDSNKDLVMEAYPEEWSNGPLLRIDKDLGHNGNEMIALEVEEDKIYYIKILPLSAGESLPPLFKVMCAFIPGGDFQIPFLTGRQSPIPAQETLELELGLGTDPAFRL